MKLTIILLYLLSIFDIITTFTGIKIGGGVEGNLIVRKILEIGGYLLFLIVKVVVISIVSIVLIKVAKIPHEIINFKRAVIISTNVFNLIILSIIVNNLIITFT